MAVKATARASASATASAARAAGRRGVRARRARERCVRSEAKFVLTQVGDFSKSQFAKETVEVKVFEVESGIRTVGRNEVRGDAAPDGRADPRDSHLTPPPGASGHRPRTTRT